MSRPIGHVARAVLALVAAKGADGLLVSDALAMDTRITENVMYMTLSNLTKWQMVERVGRGLYAVTAACKPLDAVTAACKPLDAGPALSRLAAKRAALMAEIAECQAGISEVVLCREAGIPRRRVRSILRQAIAAHQVLQIKIPKAHGGGTGYRMAGPAAATGSAQ